MFFFRFKKHQGDSYVLCGSLAARQNLRFLGALL
jgi:hypothetical protein